MKKRRKRSWGTEVKRRGKNTKEDVLVEVVRLSGRGQNKITHSGGDNEGVTPVPIPNTEVKPFSADGTWLETARESRSLPDSISACCNSAG